jgi:hypothetical protein
MCEDIRSFKRPRKYSLSLAAAECDSVWNGMFSVNSTIYTNTREVSIIVYIYSLIPVLTGKGKQNNMKCFQA